MKMSCYASVAVQSGQSRPHRWQNIIIVVAIRRRHKRRQRQRHRHRHRHHFHNRHHCANVSV